MAKRTNRHKVRVALIASAAMAVSLGATPARANHGDGHMPLQCGNAIIQLGGPGGPTTCTYDPYFVPYVIETVEDTVTPEPSPSPEPTPTAEPTHPGKGPKNK